MVKARGKKTIYFSYIYIYIYMFSSNFHAFHAFSSFLTSDE